MARSIPFPLLFGLFSNGIFPHHTRHSLRHDERGRGRERERARKDKDKVRGIKRTLQGNEVDLVVAFVALNTVTKCTQVQDFLDFHLRDREGLQL